MNIQDVQVLFADLQPSLVAGSRTTKPEGLRLLRPCWPRLPESLNCRSPSVSCRRAISEGGRYRSSTNSSLMPTPFGATRRARFLISPRHPRSLRTDARSSSSPDSPPGWQCCIRHSTRSRPATPCSFHWMSWADVIRPCMGLCLSSVDFSTSYSFFLSRCGPRCASTGRRRSTTKIRRRRPIEAQRKTVQGEPARNGDDRRHNLVFGGAL